MFSFIVCACAQLCPTLCDPMDCSTPGFFVHGIFQARILEWVVISSSRGSSLPRDWTRVSLPSALVGRFLTSEPHGKPILSFTVMTILDLEEASRDVDIVPLLEDSYFWSRVSSTFLETDTKSGFVFQLCTCLQPQYSVLYSWVTNFITRGR